MLTKQNTTSCSSEESKESSNQAKDGRWDKEHLQKIIKVLGQNDEDTEIVRLLDKSNVDELIKL